MAAQFCCERRAGMIGDLLTQQAFPLKPLLFTFDSLIAVFLWFQKQSKRKVSKEDRYLFTSFLELP
jgi:hypothetical protein